MKSKKFLAIFLSIISCISLLVFPAYASQPRWLNTNSITTVPYANYDYYTVQVEAIQEATKIEIFATLEEKNFFGIYVEKDTASGTYYSNTARLSKNYDMNPNKEYRISATVYVTANGYRETIEV